MEKTDVVIIGAGAAGLMCAIEAGKRQRRVKLIDHANKLGKKILMSGGGRCNFTNLHIQPKHYLSHNPHFCKSALSRYTQWDFIALVKQHHIPFHEKTLGQLFCDHKAKDIVDMLLAECVAAKVDIFLNTSIIAIEKNVLGQFIIRTNQQTFMAESLVIASGGLSIPTMGASPFAYKIAEQFGINVWPTRAGLVPLTLDSADKMRFAPLAGISIDCLVENDHQTFRENILFTHRGLSGPAILQISSYWQPGEKITINMLPNQAIATQLKAMQKQTPSKQLKTLLSEFLPKRIIETFIALNLADKPIASIAHRDFAAIAAQLHSWQIQPNGTEGYRTAEVTLGGVDCDALSSKTFEVNQVAGLYFIGEALDVSGWLGGFNFQWAWSSGWAAGQAV